MVTKKMVTKKQAYNHLMDRIEKGKPLGVRGAGCAYSADCAIGVFLTAREKRAILAAGLDEQPVDILFTADAFAKTRRRFEQPHSRFWNRLQSAHDALAIAISVESTSGVTAASYRQRFAQYIAEAHALV